MLSSTSTFLKFDQMSHAGALSIMAFGKYPESRSFRIVVHAMDLESALACWINSGTASFKEKNM